MMVRRTIRAPRRHGENRWLLVLAGLWTLAGTACATLIQRGYTQLIPYYELVEKMLAESRVRDAAMARVKAHLRNKAA